MSNLNNNPKTFEELLKELVVTHKNLMAYRFPAEICSVYAYHAKSFTMREYIPITEQVKKNPMYFLDLDNKYFCDFQRISELMEYSDNAFQAEVRNLSEREKEQNIKLFRASIVEKARKESKAYYTKAGLIRNENSGTGRTSNPNGEGK